MANKVFGTMPDGKEIELIVLKNANGTEVQAIGYGARLVKVLTKDKNGNLGDVILGYNDLESYFGMDFQGAVVGRFANRISNSSFEIDGVKYLVGNKGEGFSKHTLHGGMTGYFARVFEAKEVTDNSVTFEYFSADGEEGFPGNCTVTVKYTLTDDDALEIDYKAVTDKKTPVNLTNHAFFNLNGNIDSHTRDTILWIDADNILSSSDDLIPDGKLRSVDGTAFDFRVAKPIGQDIHADEHILQVHNGYDQSYVLNGEGFRKVAEAYEPVSGRNMEVYTDLPSMQLFTNNNAGRGTFYDNVPAQAQQGFCLETQLCPDAPNRPEFKSCIVAPGETFTTKTVYKFSVK